MRRLIPSSPVLLLISTLSLAASSAASGGCVYAWTLPMDGVEGGAEGDGGAWDAPSVEPSLSSPSDAAPPPGAVSSCTTPSDCAHGFYCVFADHLCGKGEHLGSCRPVPRLCASQTACGCNDTVGSPCTLAATGTDVSAQGNCGSVAPASATYFACEYLLCQETKELCRIDRVDSTSPGVPSCVSLGGCLPTSCASCPALEVVSCTCTELKAGVSYRLDCK